MIDRKRVIDLHKQGLSQDAIAAEMGCAQATVSYQLRKAGITSAMREWKSVRDGLPKHPHPVLVTVDNRNYHRQRFVQIARYENDHWVMPRGSGRVVAWMELPEEYQG